MALTFMLLLVAGLGGIVGSAGFETWLRVIASTTWGLKHSDAGHGVLVMILEPVWTAVMSVLWLDQKMSVATCWAAA